MNQLEGKVALITGAGRGIGREIALDFATAGASVGLLARTRDQIDAVAAEITAAGGRAIAIGCDVTDRDTVEAAVNQTASEFGRLDILVNNAGGGQERTVVGEDDPDTWRAVIDVNLNGTYLVCRAALPHLRTSGGGTIINVGSGMGHQARVGNSSYNCAKAGMWMLTRCLAMEVWDDGITVNELIPGPVFTELTQGIFEAGKPHPKMPAEWVKLPEEVAPLAMFLATQGNKGPTGQSFSLARRPI